MGKVAVIVLNWNQKDLSISCLESVLAQDHSRTEVIFVDNGSSDGSADAVGKLFGKRVKIVRLPENRGYCGGNNAGVRAVSRGTKYVLILNNDAVAPQDLVSKMHEIMEGDDGIGAVTVPAVEERRKPGHADRRGVTLNFFGDGVDFRIPRNAGSYQVLVPSGTCFMYRKDLVDLPFDDEYHSYAEEIYFGLRLRLMGKKVILSHKVFVRHLNSAVKKSASPQFRRYLAYLGRRNRMLNQLLFYRAGTILRLLPIFLLYHVFETVADIRYLPLRLRAYGYVIANAGKILRKRKELAGERRIDDARLISQLSCKAHSTLAFKSGLLRFIVRIINGLFCAYCRIARLGTIERSPRIREEYGILP